MLRFVVPLLLAVTIASAQNPASPPSSPAPAPTSPNSLPSLNNAAHPIFRAQLPGGVYEVAVGNIVAVTSHEYLVDGAVRVVEVNIDTNGSLLARFYFLEPAPPAPPVGIGAAAVDKAQQYLAQATEKAGVDAWKKVIKNYPTTTHARTVEYRLQSREDLNKVFAAAEEAFRLRKTNSVKIE